MTGNNIGWRMEKETVGKPGDRFSGKEASYEKTQEGCLSFLINKFSELP